MCDALDKFAGRVKEGGREISNPRFEDDPIFFFFKLLSRWGQLHEICGEICGIADDLMEGSKGGADSTTERLGKQAKSCRMDTDKSRNTAEGERGGAN